MLWMWYKLFVFPYFKYTVNELKNLMLSEMYIQTIFWMLANNFLIKTMKTNKEIEITDNGITNILHTFTSVFFKYRGNPGNWDWCQSYLNLHYVVILSLDFVFMLLEDLPHKLKVFILKLTVWTVYHQKWKWLD